MAYGNGNKDLLHKAISIGVGDLTSAKLSDLRLLREKYVEAARTMTDLVFVAEPLAEAIDKATIDKKLCAFQKGYTGFNKAYLEKARIAVAGAINESRKRYFNGLIGRLVHCSEAIPARDRKEDSRKYFYVPQKIEDTVSKDDLRVLESRAKDQGPEAVLDLFRKVILHNNEIGLTDHQAQVIREIHRQVQEKHGRPLFGDRPDFVCQIHLDYRLLPGKVDPVERINGEARLLMDVANRKYCSFLEIANSAPRGKAIRIPLLLAGKALRTLFDAAGNPDENVQVNSVIVEIGQSRVEVKADLVRSKPELRNINDCEIFVGRDFGYANTVTVTAVKRDRDIDPGELKRILAFTKAEALDYLRTHYHDMDNVVARKRFSGRRFLKLIEKHCVHIDKLKSQIDSVYNKIGRLKGILAGYFGLDKDELIAEDLRITNPLIRMVHKKFFALLVRVQHLKALRRGLYSKIAGVKKSWFGFLSNVEREMAGEKGAVIREDMTLVTPEKETPEYKGRTFNKMINNGSKGQYIRRASDKFLWDGIPEIAVPSYYTSCTCTIHSLVDKPMRSGETFLCPKCGSERHADENASDTIANYLLLRPLLQ